MNPYVLLGTLAFVGIAVTYAMARINSLKGNLEEALDEAEELTAHVDFAEAVLDIQTSKAEKRLLIESGDVDELQLLALSLLPGTSPREEADTSQSA